MTTTDANAWADFIVKLGLPFTKAEVIRYARSSNCADVWNRFIACNSNYLEAAKENHIYSPEDVESYFREVSYSHMRSTFPKRAHNRSIIGPRIIPMQKLRIPQTSPSDSFAPDEDETETLLMEIEAPAEHISKRVCHTAADPEKSFGPGTVVGVDGSRIIISFDSGEVKTLSYGICKSKGYLTFCEEQQE